MYWTSKQVILDEYPSRPDLVTISLPFNRTLQEDLKTTVPGVHYAPGIREGMWAGPREMLHEIGCICKRHGYEVIKRMEEFLFPPTPFGLETNRQLYKFQHEGVIEILRNRHWMLNYEMGLGKTPTTIEAMRWSAEIKVNVKGPCTSFLIICPANVRLQWQDELDVWWPEHPKICIVDTGKTPIDGDIVITSYELSRTILDHALLSKRQYDFVVCDESHHLMSSKTHCSKTVDKILRLNPDSFRVFLTATPIYTRPHQLWNQLHLLRPWWAGSYSAFCNRYCVIETSNFTQWIPKGLNQSTAEELARRLKTISQRATKKEWGHLMPPFVVSTIRVRTKRSDAPREVLEDLIRSDFHNARTEKFMRGLGSSKVKAAVEWVEDALKNKTHLAVLTNLKATGMEIAAELRNKKIQILYFDGDIEPKRRRDLLKEALNLPTCVVVCTMHSVKEGINTMAQFDEALLAELYWSPGLMLQVLGRFHRLSGSCNVTMLLCEGTIDEIVGYALKKRLGDMASVIKKGLSDEKLGAAFEKVASEGDESWRKELRKLVNEGGRKDAYQ